MHLSVLKVLPNIVYYIQNTLNCCWKLNVTFQGQTLEHLGSWFDGEYNIYGDVKNRTYWTDGPNGGGSEAIWWTGGNWFFGNMRDIGLYQGYIYSNTLLDTPDTCPYDFTGVWTVWFNDQWNTVPNSDVNIQCLPGWD